MTANHRGGGKAQEAADPKGLELAVAVAEGLGWQVQRHQNRYVERIYAVDASVEFQRGHHPIKVLDVNLPAERRQLKGLWRPDLDIRAAYEVERRIEKMGLHEEYAIELLRVLGFFEAGRRGEGGEWKGPMVWEYFGLIHATPEQRTLAAYRVLRDARQDPETDVAQEQEAPAPEAELEAPENGGDGAQGFSGARRETG